jgi:hypothetical protein
VRVGRSGRAAGVAAFLAAAIATGFASPSQAQEEPPEITLRGFAAFDWQQYLMAPGDLAPSFSEPTSVVAQVRLAPRLHARYRALRAVGEVEFRHDFADPGRGGRVILRELLGGAQAGGLRFEAGALLLRWGKMDVASPTDNVVAWDYEELYFPEPLPAPALRLAFARGPISLDGVFIPAAPVSRFRHESPSRWDQTWFLPRTQIVPGPFGDLEFTNHYTTFLEPVLVGDADGMGRRMEGGGRVDFFLPNVDLGISFLSAHDRLPTYTGFQLANTADTDGSGLGQHIDTLQAELDITPYHERLQIPGADLAVSLGRLVWKAEAAAFLTADLRARDCRIDDPYVKYSVGVELVLPDLVRDFDLAIRAQYNGDVATSSKERRDAQEAACPGGQRIDASDPEAGPSPTDYEHGFQATPEIRHPYSHAWYWNVNFGFTPALALDLRGFFDVAGDALIRAKLAWTLMDRLELALGGLVLLDSGEETIFTPYGRNHRVEASVAYRF